VILSLNEMLDLQMDFINLVQIQFSIIHKLALNSETEEVNLIHCGIDLKFFLLLQNVGYEYFRKIIHTL
jgi:hypothetical protein